MNLEWFDRVSGELQDHLESICEKYDQIGQMNIDRGSKHPRIEFYVETEDQERDFFCTLLFDPYNEEFYMESYDIDYGQSLKIILPDIEDIVDAVHESLHDYLNMEEVDFYDDTDEYDDHIDYIVDDEGPVHYVVDDYDYEEYGDEDHILEEIDVAWETPEVTAFLHGDEVEVTYQFGIITETGDGVLRRVNRLRAEDGELIKDESHFIFSKEEANTIIAMIASHSDKLSEFSFD
ncbi:hypothetical protein D3H55_02750 [Bacillus salacetis]|uniref:Uncharacterized protein n=1 Tax=Bacillus salacetis TaxID=2315464 RepID=A0A3A1RAQ3_9BACI|nr:hypothetical protein [Bacillus salacetis]RIW38471.1 hypothetical protein D3H55_02750 [Bacillus salacetis]